MDTKYNKILEEINKREHNKGKKIEPNEKMSINLNVLGPIKSVLYVEGNENLKKTKDGGVLFVKLRISLTYSGVKAQDIQISLNLPTNVIAEKYEFFKDSLKGNSTPYTLEV